MLPLLPSDFTIILHVSYSFVSFVEPTAVSNCFISLSTCLCLSMPITEYNFPVAGTIYVLFVAVSPGSSSVPATE